MVNYGLSTKYKRNIEKDVSTLSISNGVCVSVCMVVKSVRSMCPKSYFVHLFECGGVCVCVSV